MRRPTGVIATVCLIVLALSACTPAAPASPTAAPKPTEAPKPAAPAATAPAPTAAPAAAKPTEAAKPAAKAPLRLRAAYPSQADFEDLPTLLAGERLSTMGYQLESTFFAQPELAVEAMSRGDAEIGNGSARTYLKAIQKGAPIRVIGEQAGNSWSILAIKSIARCADLDGKRLAIHSEGAVSTAMLRVYLDKQCPQAKPNLAVIPGSENRAAALLAGQIDATPIELADLVQVQAKRADDFHVIANFAKDVPELKATLLYASSKVIAEQPQAVQDYLEAVVQVHRDINKNPKLLEEAAPKHLTIEREMLPLITKAQMDANSFDPNGGLTRDAMEFSIKFFTDAGDIDPGLTVPASTDLTFLEKVTAKLGPYR
jgi:NitT/TauT family transport system substrate-binding protein